MIDRYELSSSSEDIARLFCCGPDAIQIEAPREVVPPAPAPVLRLDESGGRRFSELRWGLVPAWAPDLSFGKVCINARAETAMTKPAFRRALRQRRCLIPADAFRAARIENGRVAAYRVERVSGGPFAFAGLWETWRSPAGETVETFTLITAGASTTRPHGMPVAIEQRHHALWLDPSPSQFDRQVRMLKPVSDSLLSLQREADDMRRFDAARQRFGALSRSSDAVTMAARAEARMTRTLIQDIGTETARVRQALTRLNARLDQMDTEPA